MGRIILQMMISVDGMISGPQGELDWIADDEQLEQAHNAILEQADVAILGAGSYLGMSGFWTAAEHDEKAKAHSRDLARAMNTASRTLMGPDRTCGDTTRPSRVATTRSIRANTVSATEGLQISLTL